MIFRRRLIFTSWPRPHHWSVRAIINPRSTNAPALSSAADATSLAVLRSLDAPILVATLSAAGGPVMTVRFGAHNPDGFLQYMRIDGDPKVYLMSRFIGAEWLAAVDAMEAR